MSHLRSQFELTAIVICPGIMWEGGKAVVGPRLGQVGLLVCWSVRVRACAGDGWSSRSSNLNTLTRGPRGVITIKNGSLNNAI